MPLKWASMLHLSFKICLVLALLVTLLFEPFTTHWAICYLLKSISGHVYVTGIAKSNVALGTAESS
jgi:hypothetical protein